MSPDEMMKYFAAMQQPQSMVQNQINMTGRGSGDQRTNLNQFGNVYQQYKPMVQLTDEERSYYDELGNGNALGAYVRSVDPRELEERGIDVNSAMYDLPSRKFTEEELKYLDEKGVAADGGNVGILNIDSQPVQDLLGQMDVSDRYMNDKQRKSGNRGNDTSGPTTEQLKEGGKLPKELDKRGFFKKQWDKFTDKDSTAPRNLLDFGLAMMANSKGAGDDFLGTTAKSVSDTIDKADARKLSALETAKENRAAKLDEAKTTSEIYENIVKQNTRDFTDGDTGTKYSETDWNQVAISLREMDPDASFYSDNYLANIVDNKIGMPEYDEDNGFQITRDGDNQEQGFKVNQQLGSVVSMHGDKTDKEKKKIKVTLNGTQTTLYDIMRSESYQKSLNKTDNQNININNLLSEVGQGNLTADQKAWVASGGKLEDFVGY
jgi:hypothetical protein